MSASTARAYRRKSAAVLELLRARINPRSKLGTLSIAQRRLVVIARGLATNARLLVLDEGGLIAVDGAIRLTAMSLARHSAASPCVKRLRAALTAA